MSVSFEPDTENETFPESLPLMMFDTICMGKVTLILKPIIFLMKSSALLLIFAFQAQPNGKLFEDK